jgi:two-component system response regulator AtoC
MQLGAYDYLEKNAGLEKLTIAVNRAIQSRRLCKKACLTVTADETPSSFIPDLLIGRTIPMREIFKKIGRVSSNRVTVLIQGESGTGKELIAKVIHYSGCTKNEPFVAVNCSALSETLLESELFGHDKGSFTGAVRTKIGKFELAHEGTVFLDEISELSLNLQVKLLRVIQERTIERVGGEVSIPVNIRIVAATNKRLIELVEENKFRQDLFFRLNVFNIEVPPLRERTDDIPLLIVHLLKKINRELNKNVSNIPYSVMEMLQNHHWNGNVRELENTLLQAVILAKSDVIEAENIFLSKSPSNNNNMLSFNNISLEELEKNYIKKVLDDTNWNKKEAAKILGIAKTTLYNKIESYQLHKD